MFVVVVDGGLTAVWIGVRQSGSSVFSEHGAAGFLYWAGVATVVVAAADLFVWSVVALAMCREGWRECTALWLRAVLWDGGVVAFACGCGLLVLYTTGF